MEKTHPKKSLAEVLRANIELPRLFRTSGHRKEENGGGVANDKLVKDVMKETVAVVEAVEDVTEVLHEQNKEAIRLENEELKVARQILKTQLASSELSVWIFRITILSALVAITSLFVALR